MVRRAAPLALDTSPTLRTWKVEDLIKKIVEGRLTTPFFQRPLKWDDADRVALFDSIRRGFPIGTLLLRQRPADGKSARLGSLELSAPQDGNVFEIVDGQQRVHTLAAAALLPNDGELRPIYYDLETFTFGVVPRSRRKLPDHWLMVATAIDVTKLVEWLVNVGLPKKQRSEAIAVGKRLREYDVPSYILETDDVAIAREVFRRTNQRGRDLTESEVFDAFFATRGAQGQLSLAGVGRAIAKTGFGAIDVETIRRSVLTILGKDPLRATATDLDKNDVKRVLPQARAALERAVEMMRGAGFMHVRIVPYTLTFVMLAAFFHRFPEVQPRTRTLLRRWIWRGALNAQHRGERSPLRAALRAIRDLAESEAAAELARQAAEAKPIVWGDGVRNPARLDYAAPRILCAAMARLDPVDVRDGTPLDVSRLFRDEEEPFAVLAPDVKGPLGQSLANRLLHPPVEAGELLAALAVLPANAWESHAIDASILDALARGHNDEALERRAKLLAEKLGAVLDARAEWKQNDRPSIDALLEGAAE
ncbi:DUF262 domain-containing protein [Sorangium sp. So ce1014]|uniref:DUF262 domain-containing protein n=1 Tax=Sorangium sp. So ce1014 TaxID=3133326 RepID=UPI003F63539E